MAFLQFHAIHFDTGPFVIPEADTLTLTHLLYFLLVLIVTNTRSEPFQSGMSYRRMFGPNHLLYFPSVLHALLKTPRPVENN